MSETKDMFTATATQNRIRNFFSHPATEAECKEIGNYINKFFTSGNHNSFDVIDFSNVLVGEIHASRLLITANPYHILIITVIFLDGNVVNYIFYEDETFSQTKTIDVSKDITDLIESWGFGIMKTLDY